MTEEIPLPKRYSALLNGKEIARFVRLEGVAEVGDQGVPGLCLWRLKTDFSWKLRGKIGSKRTTWTIGSLSQIDLLTARERAATAKNMAKRGIDPAKWLEEQRLGGEVLEQEEGIWRWETLRDAFLKDCAESKAANTLRSYHQCLTHEVVSEILGGKDINAITADDIISVRDTLRARGKRTQAANCVSIIKNCFNWARQQPSDKIPLEGNPGLEVRKGETGGGKSNLEKLPSRRALGLAFGKLENAPKVKFSERCAALLTLYSAQRRMSVASAKVEDFTPLGETDFLIWNVSHRKAGNKQIMHEIVLLKEASDIVRSLIPMARGGWLFPKERERRAGDGLDDFRHEKFVTDAFRDADLGFTPHQVRTAFSSYILDPTELETIKSEEELWNLAKEADFKLPEVKLVLDHKGGRSGDITLKHYTASRMLLVKAQIMREWVDFLHQCRKDADPQYLVA